MESKQNSGFSQRNKDFLNLLIESIIGQLTLFQEYCICKAYHAILSQTCLSWIFSCFWPGIYQRIGSCQYCIVTFAEIDSVEILCMGWGDLKTLQPAVSREIWSAKSFVLFHFRLTQNLARNLKKRCDLTEKMLCGSFCGFTVAKKNIAYTFYSKVTAFDHKTFLRVLFQK